MISMDEYLSWDAVAMGELVRGGQVTAAELEAACRERITTVDPAIDAMADVVDVAIADPEPGEAPFTGVPFAVKELLGVPGLPWTFGSRLFASHAVDEPSPYVQHLLAAGLRIVGSTTSSEFGLLGSTESALRGTTVNPWRPGISAGGSSGGAAAAVAAGIVPLAHANDGGGSIRYPASMNGLFGLMPSAGRCAPAGPAEGLAALVVEHAVSRSVRDSATLLAATERTDGGALYEPVGLVTAPGERRLRIGTMPCTLLGAEPDPAVAAALGRTAALCGRLGHRIVDLPHPAVDGASLSEAFFATAALTMAGVAAMVTPLLGRPPGPDELEPFTLELIDWAATLPPDAPARMQATFAAVARSYTTVFEHCDVVLSPTVTRPPWPLGTLAPDLGRTELIRRTEELVGYTPIHNVAGCPAMSVPLAWVDGLPVGMLFAAAPGADATLLGLAFELEAAQPWAGRRPALQTAACLRS